jgi:hypothetical protein
MKRVLCAVVAISAIFFVASCGSGSGSNGGTAQLLVVLSNTFTSVGTGSDAIAITVDVAGPGGDQGVAWYLTVAGGNCSPACGTLKPAPAPSMSAVYTPPKDVAANMTATITARAIADQTQASAFSFNGY